MECSFDEAGSYSEQGNEWDNLCIDSMCMLPAQSADEGTAFTADTQFLSEVSIISMYVHSLAVVGVYFLPDLEYHFQSLCANRLFLGTSQDWN